MASDNCYFTLARKVLDLVSHRHLPNSKDPAEYREGFDTLMEGIDKEAEDIIKKWVIENLDFITEDVKKDKK